MSMFDNRMQRWISNWYDDYSPKPQLFRNSIKTRVNGDGSVSIGFYHQRTGSFVEFVKMDEPQWQSIIATPGSRSRAGGTAATRFFLYHWLEETNKLDTFINYVKESQHA